MTLRTLYLRKPLIIRFGYYYVDGTPLIGKIVDINVWDRSSYLILSTNSLTIVNITVMVKVKVRSFDYGSSFLFDGNGNLPS